MICGKCTCSEAAIEFDNDSPTCDKCVVEVKRVMDIWKSTTLTIEEKVKLLSQNVTE